MKLCEKCEGRRVCRMKPPVSIQSTCNRVECTDQNGKRCECWVSYPTNDPFHRKDGDIIIDERKDSHISSIYYGLSAMAMGAVGVILFIALWIK